MRAAAAAGCLLALAAPSGCRPAPAEPAPVILVGIDGFHPDYLARPAAARLRAFAAGGVRARALVGPFPSKTFPSLYTMVTGLTPDHHGVVSNTMRDPVLGRFAASLRDQVGDGRWWGGEPIWVTAIRQGRSASVMFWPGSEAAIAGTRPTRWFPFDSTVPYRSRVDTVLAWLALPPAGRPAFVAMYLEKVDVAGHRFGPAAAEVDSAIAETDRAVARLVDGLVRVAPRGANVLIVSDHGMAEVPPGQVIYLDDFVDSTAADVVELGSMAGLIPQAGVDPAQVIARLRDRHPRMRAYGREELVTRFGYGTHPRIPPVVVLAEPGWRLGRRAERWSNRGEHGYDPAAPSMEGVFLAAGPAFREGTVVDPFASVHLYELLAHLLGLAPAPNGGALDSVRALLR